MKNLSRIVFLAALLLLPSVTAFSGQDMREMQIRAREERQALLEKAEREKEAAQQEAEETRRKILSDRRALEDEIARLETENQDYTERVAALETERAELTETEKNLDGELEEADAVVRELVGAIRVNAKDVDSIISDGFRSVLSPETAAVPEGIADGGEFPGMDDIRRLSEVLFAEIRHAGSVRKTTDAIIDRSGRETEAEILLIGNFTAAYRTGGETGFLNHSPAGDRLFALSRLPSGRMQGQIDDYMDGNSIAAPMDVTRGGALRQLTHQLSLWEQIPRGGPIVWPIVVILGLGIVIIIERVIFLARKRFDADGFMNRIDTLLREGEFEKCRFACEGHGKKPLARVIGAGLSCCHMPRDEMENALQEAILREIPPMERFLSTLGMLAAIAPLLGLLGTVTGMINTFHVITLYGTGDPRMMSGGISEALVTTMLGLSVAIPMLMAHTWLHRAVDKNIGEMEEKAVTLVNIAHKSRGDDHHHEHPQPGGTLDETQ